jgi:hypothetical protein
VESQRRLKLSKWAWLGWACFALVLGSCGDSSESQTDTGNSAPGIDPFCDTRPKLEFCEDFDTAELPGAFEEQRSDLSTMTLDSAQASSLPRSLLITVESGGSGELRQTFEPGGKLRLFGMLFVPELGVGDVEIASFALGDYRVGFGVSDDGSLWGYEQDNRLAGTGSIPVGRWASFRWDVNIYDDGTGNANLRFGNDVMFETDALSTPGSAEVPVTTVGLSNASGAWAAQFDNLTVAIEEAVQ